MDSPSPKPLRRGMEAFAFRDFRRYQLARVAVILGAEAQSVAVAWQVYSITHRALDLGFTGLALCFPGLLFLLPAGHVADRFDRRQIILVCYGLQVVATTVLLLLTRIGFHGAHPVYPIYCVLFFMGTARAFSGPASSALIPHLVPEAHFVNAVTWGGAIWQFSNITGPALGGLLFTLPLAHWVPDTALQGAGIVYVFTLGSLGWFMVLVGSLHTRPGRMEHSAASLKVVLAGFQYVRRSPMLLGASSLDLFVVLLGGATALMPIFAHDILHQGPRGLGMLRAAPAVGALAMSLLMAWFRFRRRAGLRLFVCVAIYGSATVVFGLSEVAPIVWIGFSGLKLKKCSVVVVAVGMLKSVSSNFKVLWECRKTVLSFSALSIRPAFPRPVLSRVRPPELLADGGSIPGRASVPPDWSAGVGSCRTRCSTRSCFWLRQPTRRRAGRRARI